MNLIIVPVGEGTKDDAVKLVLNAKPIGINKALSAPQVAVNRHASSYEPFNRNKPKDKEEAPVAATASPSILEMT